VAEAAVTILVPYLLIAAREDGVTTPQETMVTTHNIITLEKEKYTHHALNLSLSLSLSLSLTHTHTDTQATYLE
jgi:hypothetical protein